MSSAKGSHYERELVSRFLDGGWGAVRLAASGAGGDADLPDVFAGRPALGRSIHDEPAPLTTTWAIELKAGKSTTLYVGDEEVADLRRFAQQWGARPFLGARFTTQGSGTETCLVAPDDARGPTDGGRYGLPVADIEERAAVIVGDDGVRQV